MTAAVLHVWLSVLCLGVIGWGGYLVGLIVVDTVQRGRAAAHRGASWDCRCLDCRDGRWCSR